MRLLLYAQKIEAGNRIYASSQSHIRDFAARTIPAGLGLSKPRQLERCNDIDGVIIIYQPRQQYSMAFIIIDGTRNKCRCPKVACVTIR